MNRGTALKWFDAIKSGKYEFGRGALRTNEKCFCIYGVLADFLDPSGWAKNALGIYEWHGEVNFLPEAWRKRCKMKSLAGEFVTDNKENRSLVDINDSSTSFEFPLFFARKYYEQL